MHAEHAMYARKKTLQMLIAKLTSKVKDLVSPYFGMKNFAFARVSAYA